MHDKKKVCFIHKISFKVGRTADMLQLPIAKKK